MNGKGSYFDNDSRVFESFTVTKGTNSFITRIFNIHTIVSSLFNHFFYMGCPGKTYWFRISNVGTAWSVNFRIQNHRMVLVETEGSYVNQMALDSLDVHVGQSYSVLVTADQEEQDYYIVAAPKQINATGTSNLIGVAVLRYGNSVIPPRGALPPGPDPFNIQFSVNQAKSIR